MNFRILDLSQPLFDNCPNCPVHPAVELPVTVDHPTHGWHMEMIHMASHTGTHLDAPLHKLAGGKSIDQLPLETFMGPVIGFELSAFLEADSPIDADLLERASQGLPDPRDRIALLDTGWGRKREKTDEWLHHSPYLAPSGAEWLVSRRIRAVGIDHYSIGGSRDPDNTRTHQILLGAGVWVVEDLSFPAGWTAFADGAIFQALPLLLPGFSGSPCRAVLIQSK